VSCNSGRPPARTPPVPVDVDHLPELRDELDQPAAALLAVVAREADWTLRRASGWSIGQHVEHVARSLALTAQGFERAVDALERDALPKRPWRDPLQAVFVKVVTGRRFGAVIESTGNMPAQIVVERAMYSSGFAAGTNALATRLQ